MTKENILFTHSFKSKIGTIRIASTSKGLAILTLPGESGQYFKDLIKKNYPNWKTERGGSINRQVEKQIEEYLNGKLKKFTIKLDWQTTPFREKALKQIAKIPYGKTKTYGEIAKAIGNSKASRAVGSANATNKIPIIIPCHRVLASNGLGGYGGGLELKKKLLKIEGAI
ncbi:MAG: methylated-DNA--[protein]-cysteine S-methyltransferase [candidate division Zixibacteria bacterium]|nr:methylated-DNA--[protein]-cysteine S-methyltransferase [candidate division Zixibacteria bacterium]